MEMPCMIDFKDKRVTDICSRMQKASKKITSAAYKLEWLFIGMETAAANKATATKTNRER